ncbi:PaaI family thioesterase [Streptomyces sp. SID3343]|uniref:PaaI family thioesterase n=1 Tax=Streptomyces sp. SID3343 TaxID=2690260 RepID=UPI00136BFCD2|nr:PaaI family thioesterase [Streptomyces sp. SID3343]MYV99119.1 PaaI family thioesterase [Streptomyces sp. SID3343]
MTIDDFIQDDTPADEVDRRAAVLGSLADTVRDLVDATIRTTVPNEQLLSAQADLADLVTLLRANQLPGPASIRHNSAPTSWSWGNAVIGLANAIAPPLRLIRNPGGVFHAEVHLGAAYEGPPGLVHGGVSAMLLDHLMGETASASRGTIFTGTLTTRYRRGTPLGPLRLEARITHEEGRKVFVAATISDPEGVTVEADGVFIRPASEAIQPEAH